MLLQLRFILNLKTCYVLTIDGWGDDASSKIFEFEKWSKFNI